MLIVFFYRLKESREGFRSDRLNYLTVCKLLQRSAWWKVDCYMLEHRKEQKCPI